MVDMTIDGKALNQFLETVKPITTKRFNVPYEDWVFFDGDFAYAFNGLYFYHTPFKAPGVMALPAKRTLLTLPKDSGEIGVLLGKDYIALDTEKSQVDFAYPFKSIEEYMRSFYVEGGDIENEVQHDFLECLEFCSQTIFKENIEYSNIYVYDGNAYSTEGSRISVHPCTLDNTSLSIGIEKVLQSTGEPDTFVVNDSVVSFKIGDAVLSVSRNIGNHNAVTDYVPSSDALVETITVNNAKNVLAVLKKAQSFDTEFKKKDTQVTVTIADGKAEISIEGVKSKFREDVEIESTKDVSFKVHPSHLYSVVEMEAPILFGPPSHMKATDGYRTRYLWVEK